MDGVIHVHGWYGTQSWNARRQLRLGANNNAIMGEAVREVVNQARQYGVDASDLIINVTFN